LELHGLGPVLAAGLILWSVDAIRQRMLYPRGLAAWHLGLLSSALLLYWAGRMVLHFGLGFTAFPSS